MLKHIVMFRMKDVNSSHSIRRLKDTLDQLKNKIPEVKALETGINVSKSPSAFDLVLYSEFKHEEDLETYREHPDHKEVLKFIKEHVAEVKVVDYLI